MAHLDALRARLVVSGQLLDAFLDAFGTYSLSLEFFAGSPVVEAELQVFGLGDAGLVEDLGFELPVAAHPARRVRLLGGAAAEYAGRSQTVTVSSLDGRFVRGGVGDKWVALDPARRVGLLERGSGPVAVALVASRLRPNAPRSVEAPPGGGLRHLLHAGPFFLDEDFAAGSAFAFAVLPMRERGRIVDALTAERVLSLRGTEHADSALEVASLLRVGRIPLELDAAPRLLGRVDDAVHAEVGYRDFGDYRYGYGFANLEYDPARAFLLRYLATGDARHFRVADDMLRHWTLYDRSRGEAAAPAGIPWLHGTEHRTLEYEAGHVWAGGIALGAMVTGSAAYRRAADELRDALLVVAGDRTAFGDERCYAWVLLALDELQRLEARPEVDRAADRLLADLLRRQHPRGFFTVDRPGRSAEFATWSPSPWVTAGLTMEALYRWHRRRPDPELRRALEGAVTFLLQDARDEKGRFCKRVHYGSGPKLERVREGRADAVDAVSLAAGLGRASLLGLGQGVREAFDGERLRAARGLGSARLSANRAARALVGLLSVADTEARLAGW